MTERGAQHGDAATEILGNALRLYSDAKLLFENGRFASCASLSVLAIEELAKFMGMIGAQPLPVRSWRSHPDKHVGSASFLLRKRYQAALREVLEETGAADPDADYRRLADMEYRDDEMALFESVLARIVSDGSLGRFSRAHVKETDRVKQLGFYVDLDDQMRVRSTPSQVTSVLAKDHLNFARDVLETLRSISLTWTASQRCGSIASPAVIPPAPLAEAIIDVPDHECRGAGRP